MTPVATNQIKLALPKGRMERGVFDLLQAAGIEIRAGSRTYLLGLALPRFESKLLTPQYNVEVLYISSAKNGVIGDGWVRDDT